jgi:hypothetical protein
LWEKHPEAIGVLFLVLVVLLLMLRRLFFGGRGRRLPASAGGR